MKDTAQETFDALAQTIDDAVKTRDFCRVCEDAETLGLVGGRIDLPFSLRYAYRAGYPSGAELTVDAFSYDPSGPTRTYPCVTRFKLTLMERGTSSVDYENEFEGLVDPSYAHSSNV